MILKVCIMFGSIKDYFALNEASWSNFNKNKRMSKWQPFWNKVYCLSTRSLGMKTPVIQDYYHRQDTASFQNNGINILGT